MWYKNILMKGVTTFLLLALFCLNIQAQQVRISVNIPPPYPIHLEDYFSFDRQSVVTLTNMTNTTLKLKLITSVTDNRGIEGHVKDAWNPLLPIVLNPMEVKVMTGLQLQDHFANLAENDATITGIDVNQVIRTETLPEGMYQVCVKALAVADNQLLSGDSGCTNVFLTNYDPPVILAPSDEASVSKQSPQFVNFTWTPSGMAGITRYRLQLVDMTAVGLFNPNDAFEGQIQIQPFYEKENLVATTYPYSISDPVLEVNHQYAVRVTAYDPQGTLAFKNEGKSAVTTFTYKLPQINNIDAVDVDVVDANFPPNNQGGIVLNSNANNDEPDPPNGACVSNTKYEGAFGAPKSTISNGTDVKVGYFVMKNTVFTKKNGGAFNGTGTIKVNFLNTTMKVEFTGIKVDNNNRLKSGKITGKVTSGNIINSQMATAKDGVMDNLPNAQGLYDKLQEGNRLVSQLSPDNAIDLPISWDSDKYNVGIVGLIFEPTEAYVNAILPIDVPQAMNGDWLNISTKGIKIHPNGFGDAEIKISLAGDKSLPLSNNVDLMVKGGNDETYVLLDCDGFNSLHIKGAMVLSRKIALPLDNNYKVISNPNTKVSVPFEIDGSTDFEDFLLPELTLSHPFSVPEAQDFVMEASAVSFDFSTSKNSNTFKSAFPNKGNDWIGVYMKSLKLTLPKGFKKEGGGVIKIDIADFMIDKMGVTGNFSAASNPLAKGSIAGWNFDLDKVDIQIKNSKLTGSGLGGSVHIPLGKKANFGFWAKVQKGNSQGANYEFELDVEDEIEADLFIANIKLFKGSKIIMVKKNGKFEADTDLNGAISVKFSDAGGNAPDNSNVSNFDLPNLKFEQLSITGKDVPNFVPEFDLKFFALEGQDDIQAKLGFFELGLDKLAFEKGADGKVGLTIGMGITLFGGEGEQSTGVSAATEFTLWAKYEKAQKTFAYSNAQLKSLELKGDIGVAYVSGKIDIYSQDETFGNGFRGTAQVEVTGVNVGVSVTMQFGRTLPAKGDYKYWYFDAMVKVPIPVPSTPMTIYGFGGGAWYNMSRSGGVDGPLAPDQFVAKNSQNQQAPTASGANFSPVKDNVGFKVSVLFGVTGSETAFNGDLTFSLDFNKKTLAVQKLELDGNGYIMQSPDKKPRSKDGALLKLHANIKIKPIIRQMTGQFSVALDVYGLITGGGQIDMKFQLPKKDNYGNVLPEENLKWFIKVGSWSKPEMFSDSARLNASIGFDKKIAKLKIDFRAYFMAGNDLPGGLPPLPSYIYSLFEGEIKQTQPLSNQVSSTDILAFAFGAGIRLDAGFDFAIVSADLRAEAAFDVLISDLQANCNGKEIGFHGWYAKGQAYAYVKGVAMFLKIPILSLTAAALVQVELPNPTWVKGMAKVYIDNVEGEEAKEYSGTFEYGERCDNVDITFDPYRDDKLVKNITPDNNTTGVNPFHPQFTAEFYYNCIYGLLSVENPYTGVTSIYQFNEDVKLMDATEKEEIPCKFQTSKFKVKFSPKQALQPQTEYHIIVKAYIKGGPGNKKVSQESYTIVIKTGDYPSSLTIDDLKTSYPLPGQRYFMKESFDGGASLGVLGMKNDMCYLFENIGAKKGYAVITDLKTKKTYESPCNCGAGNRIYFDIPQGLKNRTMYELKIVLKKPASGGENNDIPKTIFEGLYFKTSKYNNMNQKMSKVKVAKVVYMPAHYSYTYFGANFDKSFKIPVVLLDIDEPFERYDVELYNYNYVDQYGDEQTEEGGRLVSSIKDNYDWTTEVKNKHRYFTTLSPTNYNYLLGATDHLAPDVRNVNRPSGYPYYGKKGEVFSLPGSKFIWMRNYAYYQQWLKNYGELSAGESLIKPSGRLTPSEISKAKGGGMGNFPLQINNQGGGLQNDLPLLSEALHAYFPIIDFTPDLMIHDKIKFNMNILKRAKLNGKFNKTLQILNSLGLPAYPKKTIPFHLNVWEPRIINGKAHKNYNFNYTVTKN